jgi:hypothetical protein
MTKSQEKSDVIMKNANDAAVRTGKWSADGRLGGPLVEHISIEQSDGGVTYRRFVLCGLASRPEGSTHGATFATTSAARAREPLHAVALMATAVCRHSCR